MTAHSSLATQAVELAGKLLESAHRRLQPKDAKALAQVARMMEDPKGKAATLALCDRVFRPTSARAGAQQLRSVVRDLGVPRYLSTLDRILFAVGAEASRYLPWLVMPQVVRRLRGETGAVILPAEPSALGRHLQRRQAEGVRLNLNRLGEAILGEEEAQARFQANLQLLADPKVNYISVKVSSICSQVSSLGFEKSLTDIQQRLRELYRACLRRSPAAFINLDMEEYRDLELTTEAFIRTLSEPEFHKLEAGIVLQAYLPDAFLVQQRLTAWALSRVQKGGAPIKVRLVKGANLAMERVEAELHGWEQAPYLNKADVDANFRRMLLWAAQPQHITAVKLGVGSHNLFDLALALVLRTERKLGTNLSIEMLEGMAPHQAAAVRAEAGDLLLYAPVVPRDDFGSAVAYLIRRLDENTTEGNFLRDLFALELGSPAWERQKQAFLKGMDAAATVAVGPRRQQTRTELSPATPAATFHNAADTDWTAPHNRQWIAYHLELLRVRELKIPLSVGGQESTKPLTGEGRDPSRPGLVAYTYAVADAKDVAAALACAHQAVGQLSSDTLRATLLKAAQVLERRRGEIIAAMVLDGGKTVAEADGELSEAVDFAEYYARAFDDKAKWSGALPKPLGVVTVTPPWNFPFAIPLGGVAAALRAGNAVILKPAPEAVYCGRLVCEVMWEAGIPKELLQFVPAPDNEVGRQLIEDKRVATVILTGASSTADLFLSWRPELRLLAETSGKNALIVTPAADRDAAIKDVVKSAFGHAGQKCSACSLLILVGELGDDKNFLRQLRDAAASLRLGSAWDLATSIPPLIRTPEAILQRGLTQLDAGETWLLKPAQDGTNPNLWSPGIRLGVTTESWFFSAECFGPVLGVVKARNLEHALTIANQSHLGLTGGLHSLDAEEIAYWIQRVQVGNAYVNRPITGAIVQRQPFGGWKRSAYGPGAKAGGTHYVPALCRWEDDPSADIISLHAPEARAAHANVHGEDPEKAHFALSLPHFIKPIDVSALAAESNVTRRVPAGDADNPRRIVLRLAAGADNAECRRALKVVLAMKHVWVVSIDRAHDPYLIEAAAKVAAFCEVQDDLEFAEFLSEGSRVRVVGSVGASLREAARIRGATLFEGPVTRCPALEFAPYYLEQALSVTRHRHGNLLPDPHYPPVRAIWEDAGLIRPST